MEPDSLTWVGSPCGLHGPYIFYKAFRFNLEGKARILSLGDFFFVRCKPGDPVCIAELQLLWEERTSKQLLSSSKLYFLPEDTPQGRTVTHGEDEVIAVSEKVIVKLDDLVKWTVWEASCWKTGLRAMPLKPSTLKELGKNGQKEALHRYRESTLNSGLNFKDVLREKAELGEDAEEKRVLVLSYPQYCRYRSIIARLRERPASLLTDQVVLALGGIASLTSNTQILYCRDTFEHPTLLENESICDEFAPNLKGRPRKKKLSISQRRDSQGQSGNGKESGSAEGKSKVKGDSKAIVSKPKSSSGSSSSSKRQAHNEEKPKEEGGEECRAEEQAFLVALYKYMKERKTPIERIPYLGFKQINLWTMFQAAQKLGGYELITARRQWKNVYDELGGNPGSTSAATCTRRHYERLILPYERFTKGEEDKPLPPIKPRKQEAGAQEGGAKTKVPSTKRLKDDQNPKGRSEKDASAKVSEPGAEDIEDKEQLQEDLLLKQKPQKSQLPVQREGEVISPSLEDDDVQLIIKEDIEEKLMLQKVPWDSSPHEPVSRSKHASLPQDGTPLKSEDSDVFPVAASMPLRHSNPFAHPHTQDQWQHGTPEYKVPAYTLGNIEQTENQNHVGMVLPTLKQRPLQPLSVPKIPTERAELPTKEESFSYNSLLYPRINPGIMSPLAKKKMLSQVSGTGLPSNYPYGPPPPLVNKKASASSTEETAAGQHGPQVPSTASEASVVIKRPSVIQHAQSFKPRGTEDRKPSVEASQREARSEGDSEPPQHQPLHQSQTSPTREPYIVRASPHSSVEKSTEIPRPGQAPSFLGDFYSSTHLHNLYRQAEHHLSKEQLSKYLSREAYPRDSEIAHGFPQSQQPDSGSLTYCASLNQKEKGPPSERVAEEQPTDLSLPKPSSHKLHRSSTPSLSGLPHSMIQQDVKSTPLFQAGNSQSASLDYHPRACRVPPMTVSTPKKVVEPQPKAHSGRADEALSYKLDEMARPILTTKSSPQNVGAARPLKRNLEELENGPTEKKIRAVTPMHCSTPRDTSVKVRTPEPDNESMKPAEPAHAVHINSYAAEGHKFPLHSPIFPGLYPGAFVSQVQDMCDSLGPHVPPGYSHPLQYLKNQAVISPLMPPFAIHSIMMQRQFLAQAANPAHLYRHPVGTSYGDILHHGLYPMSALNPQPAFSPPQLSSVHPSTKLS
ncbi:AT-rich interactive domain-containing protein 5B [Astyanax mexicanus]|uniref:AT-rich interactive domain-containing protein 5B n=1 Tax=Astyanax mexicanus TaxID=7994 RepID=UPI0020CAE36C|nr:AT-rich interactive domain-containing protein 5B [Astyanax mexicanus]